MTALSPSAPQAPAVFRGWQDGAGIMPSFRLYNLTAPAGHYPVNSTVSEMTLRELGYALPEEPSAAEVKP